VQRFKSEVVNGLGTDQRGGETSNAGVIDESLVVLLSRGCLAGYRRFRVWPADCSNNPESTWTGATRHSRRSNVCGSA